MSNDKEQYRQSENPESERSRDSKPLTNNPTHQGGKKPQSVPSTAQLPQTGALSPSRLEEFQHTKRIRLGDAGDGYSIEPGAIKPEDGLALFLPEQAEPMIFKNQDVIGIGRVDPSADVNPELDLTPYHGAALGVSRFHAVITRVKNTYQIKDMGSTNGTRINGKKLPPYTLTPITSGDQIRLGHLVIVVG